MNIEQSFVFALEQLIRQLELLKIDIRLTPEEQYPKSQKETAENIRPLRMILVTSLDISRLRLSSYFPY